MEDRFKRVYETTSRVLEFMNANAADFEQIAIVKTYLDALKAAQSDLTRLGEQKVTTTNEARSATVSRADSREALRDDLRDITDLWKTIASNVGDGGKDKFRTPRSVSDQSLLDAARSFHTEAEPFKNDFIAYGLAPDFLTDLQNDINNFDEIINESDSSRRERIGTNAAFVEPSRDCTKIIGNLDPIVRIKYRQNPQKTAEWIVASHIQRPPKRKTPPRPPKS
ncbi:MAG: hypothetical protein H7Z37_00660 [Pyrinomonadaceae bacterium]|nr:hypothetical protein [Pyrinomonadaceae bacterium]